MNIATKSIYCCLKSELWLVKYKEPLTLAVERLLPANALFRCLHDDECTGATEKKNEVRTKMKTYNWNKPIRNFQSWFERTTSTYLNSVGAKFRNCNVHVLLANEISRQSTSNAAATKTTTAESTKNVEVWSKKASTDVKFEIPHYFIYLFGARFKVIAI